MDLPKDVQFHSYGQPTEIEEPQHCKMVSDEINTTTLNMSKIC